MTAGLRLSWIPVGAGQHVVRRSTMVYEALAARRQHRPSRTLYHAALEVHLDSDRWVVEMTPAWGGPGGDRGVTVTGPVGSRRLGSSRLFRYEVRVWRDGVVPDLELAVGAPVPVVTDEHRTRALLAAGSSIPALTWGRDELGLGEMWNSNSVVCWLLVRSGHDVAGLGPPGGGRAPGWFAGLELARRAGGGPGRPAASSPTSSSPTSTGTRRPGS